jgi:hypothetical protein
MDKISQGETNAPQEPICNNGNVDNDGELRNGTRTRIALRKGFRIAWHLNDLKPDLPDVKS